MANKQAWWDFSQITRLIEEIESAVRDIINKANRLEHDKIEIFDDLARKNELKKIVDIHPDWTLTQITDYYTKIMALKTYIQTNL